MAITKVTGALVDIGDLDLTNVGTLHLDSIVSDASPAAITIGYGVNDTLTINGSTILEGAVTINESSADVDFRVESNGDTHRLFIDGGNDRLLIGTTASVAMSGVTPSNFLEGTAYASSTLGMAINANGANESPLLMFGKSRGTSLGSNTIVQTNDRLFSLRVHGSDGTNQEQAALIEAHVDAAPANNSVPGRLSFWTTNDGAQYATEKMRINNAGAVTMPSQPAFSAITSAALTDIATNASDNTVKFGTEIYDQNSDFDTSTFTFTAPVTGKYQLNANVFVQNSDASCTYIRVKIATSNRNYVNIIDPEYDADRERDIFFIAVLADMDANDTALVQIAQYEGTAQMDVPASTNSIFSGFLAC